ncbi:hypothetical protein J3Q64DRAFT_1713841 [Phycomyces blakesleeanus]|uniref:Uncharacterized protein n=1 Tax=Phycomyces blakesleeanus TaxID=4837 RepID=A0ABR3BFD5_PHYBL
MGKQEAKQRIDTHANEILKTQIDASIGIARSVVHSWLPAPKEGEKLEDDDDSFTLYTTGRPDRLGLGAKFLSHADAMRHTPTPTTGSKEEIQLRNKILNQNRRSGAKDQYAKRKEESEDEEESRTQRPAPKKAKKAQAAVEAKPGPTKKIGQQGDFLSMYLSERSKKKKKS